MDSADTDLVEQAEATALEALGQRFLDALARRNAGDVDGAEDGLRGILRSNPRLAEPRLELARLLLDMDRLEEAEDQAREALSVLEAGGQWVDELPENVVLSVAHATLAEILRRHADEDDVIFGDPDAFHALVREAKEHFESAAALDPSEETASYYATFLGLPGATLLLQGTDGKPEDSLLANPLLTGPPSDVDAELGDGELPSVLPPGPTGEA